MVLWKSRITKLSLVDIRSVKSILSSEDEKSRDFRSTTEMLIKQLLFGAKNEQLFSSLLQILFSDPGKLL